MDSVYEEYDDMTVKTVLIADDDQALARAISIRCRELGLETETCHDGIKAYKAILSDPPDLLILDVNMPGADGLYLSEELSNDPGIAPIPTVILTGQSDEDTVNLCKRLGTHYVWKGLDTWEELKPLICQLLDISGEPAQEEEQVELLEDTSQDADSSDTDDKPKAPKILLIDDDPDLVRVMKIRLESLGLETCRAYSGMQGFWTALKELPDVIIMDFLMPECCGNILLAKFQNHSLTRNIPIIVLTGKRIGGQKDYSLERELNALGAAAFLTKPPDFGQLVYELGRHIIIPEHKVPTSLWSPSS